MINITADHEGGCLDRAVKCAEDFYALLLRPDTWYYFNFKITGCKGKNIIFQFMCRDNLAPDHNEGRHRWLYGGYIEKPLVSYDNGKSWSKPISTGIGGQASSLCAIGGEKLLALHSVRRDTDRPGIYAYVIDFSERTWKIVDEAIVFEPVVPVMKDNKLAEIFSYLKFGQPGAILLSDGDILMSHWYAQDGRYQTVATRIKL